MSHSKSRPIQQEAFDPDGNPIPEGDCLWDMQQAMHYVCDHLKCSPATFYRTYRHRINFQAYGWNAKQEKPCNFKCRKLQVKAFVRSVYENPIELEKYQKTE